MEKKTRQDPVSNGLEETLGEILEGERLFIPLSVEKEYMVRLSKKIREYGQNLNKNENTTKKQTFQFDYLIGIGGGRVCDSAKYLAKKLKMTCILIPSVLSTTAWLNPVASLKERVHGGDSRGMKDKDTGRTFKVVHEKGRRDRILIIPALISSAPFYLNMGGLADILCGYSAIIDWYIAHKVKGKRFPKKVLEEYLPFLEQLKKSNWQIEERESWLERLVDGFLTAYSNCFGLLSGRPMEGSEHFLYYLLEKNALEPMNHGQIIALNTLISLWLQERWFTKVNTEEDGNNNTHERKLTGEKIRNIWKDLKRFYDKVGLLEQIKLKLGVNKKTKDISMILDNPTSLLRKYQLNWSQMPKFVKEKQLFYTIWNEHDSKDLNDSLFITILKDVLFEG